MAAPPAASALRLLAENSCVPCPGPDPGSGSAGVHHAGADQRGGVCGGDHGGLQSPHDLQLHNEDVPLQEHGGRAGGGERAHTLTLTRTTATRLK